MEFKVLRVSASLKLQNKLSLIQFYSVYFKNAPPVSVAMFDRFYASAGFGPGSEMDIRSSSAPGSPVAMATRWAGTFEGHTRGRGRPPDFLYKPDGSQVFPLTTSICEQTAWIWIYFRIKLNLFDSACSKSTFILEFSYMCAEVLIQPSDFLEVL